jgi:hypothetical protein
MSYTYGCVMLGRGYRYTNVFPNLETRASVELNLLSLLFIFHVVLLHTNKTLFFSSTIKPLFPPWFLCQNRPGKREIAALKRIRHGCGRHSRPPLQSVSAAVSLPSPTNPHSDTTLAPGRLAI